MTATVKQILNCIGVDTSVPISVLRNGFGFIRARVPTDPDTTVTAQVSLLQQLRECQGESININVIRVGYDALPAATADDDLEKLDYAVYKCRNIFRQVSVGVARVQHWFIDQADANGRDDIGSADEQEALADEWTVPNDGIDAFVVRTISATFIGRSPIDGACDKDDKDDGLLGGDSTRGYDGLARTFAHEIGHYLTLEHNHGGRPACPNTTAGQNNLMAQTRCAVTVRGSTLLTNGQGSDMRGHCMSRVRC